LSEKEKSTAKEQEQHEAKCTPGCYESEDQGEINEFASDYEVLRISPSQRDANSGLGSTDLAHEKRHDTAVSFRPVIS